jgi:hypothetical protein
MLRHFARRRYLSGLRLVWADWYTSYRSGAAEEAEFGQLIALRRNGKW